MLALYYIHLYQLYSKYLSFLIAVCGFEKGSVSNYFHEFQLSCDIFKITDYN